MQYPIINWTRAAAKCNNSTIEFFSLTCTPHEENCTPASNNPEDNQHQISECTALINQLIRSVGTPPEGAQFFIVENTGHDFGTYYEAGIFYIPTPAEQEDTNMSEIYASDIEGGLIPDHWDANALQELRQAGHPMYQPAKVVKMKVA